MIGTCELAIETCGDWVGGPWRPGARRVGSVCFCLVDNSLYLVLSPKHISPLGQFLLV